MTRDFQAKITDATRLRASVAGVGIGCLAFFSHGLNENRFLEIAPAKLQLLVVLSVAFLAGAVAALSKPSELRSKRLAVGIGARMGVRAGLFCAIGAGGLLALLATLDSGSADTAAAENVLRHRMWFVFWVNWTAILPAALCGFLGGMAGGGMVAAHLPDRDADLQASRIPGIRLINLALVLAATTGLASPLSFLGRPLRVDPPPVVRVPEPRPQPTPFEYLPPEGIKAAKLGQIQPAFTKVIEHVQDDAAMSLSPDGNLLAYGDRSASQPAVCIFDLPTFKRVATMAVPAFPRQCLAWSPDQKGLACTIGDGGDRRIWILNLDSNWAVELPRPPGRDTPTGDVFWLQKQELAFFPNDEPALAFDLVSLMLKPVETSSSFAKIDAETRRLWLKGPRLALPSQVGWKLDVCTVIRSAEPPPRRHPDDSWRLGGESVCALSHPDLPLSFGFDSLPVKEGMRVLCCPDGSKIIRVHGNRAEVSFMKLAAAPPLHLEVLMPFDANEIKDEEWKQHVAGQQLCAFVCAPLLNPLTNLTIGPDYQQVRGIARLIEWKDRNAAFLLTMHDRSIRSTDVLASLHTWEAGNLKPWNLEPAKTWWVSAKPISRELPQKLSVIDTPSVLALAVDGSSFVAVKTADRAPPPRRKEPESPRLAEGDVQAFITAHHAKASKGDVAGMVADYDSVVDFLDKGQVSPGVIAAEEKAHRQKWPNGHEEILGPIAVTSESSHWTANYTIQFYNESTTLEWNRGKVDLTLTLLLRNTKLCITSQKARVYDLQDSKTMAKSVSASPSAQVAEPQTVAITVPRPCYVTSMRVGDRNEIEITDQISFANGLTWHRTYREMSRDGKVLNVCRAIYEGSGGVSQDRQGARFYVGSQGWERNLGKQKFVGRCEKSAAAFVGREFRFRLTSDGMIEEKGIVFQLRR